jgi:peptidyl-prolyl cis-trans isomerase A (cyclophilin A)
MIQRMRKTAFFWLLTLAASQASAQIVVSGEARVRIETTVGDFIVELDANRAPITVQNFLQNAVNDFYDGTIFHRVAVGFLIQGGGYLPDLTLKPTESTVFNESGNGLSNRRGTIAMARSNDAHSANTQFYINLSDNSSLNPSPQRWGYAVFGEVVEGMEIVDRIGSVQTGAGGEFDRDVPVAPIVIRNIELLQEEE